MQQRKILIIEDDTELADVIARKLENAGFATLSTTDGLEGVRIVDSEELDLILLDLTLPDVDGIDVLRHLRQRTALPIVIISGRTEEAERVVGLELGADDYMAKPFGLNELLARVHVVLRRAEGTMVDSGLFKTEPAAAEQQEPAPPSVEAEVLSAMDIEMDIPARRVWVGNEEAPLTRTEFIILQTLLENQGKVISHQMLLQAAWGEETDDTHLVEVHMANLRAKIEEDPRNPQRIQTVRGFGYRLG